MNQIKFLRTLNGIKQSDLADAINVSRAALSGYETGKYEADISTYVKIADYFKVSLDFLLGREPLEAKECNDFFRYIESMGYHTLINGNHFDLIENKTNKSVPITEGQLKFLVRNSKRTISSFLHDCMECNDENNDPEIEAEINAYRQRRIFEKKLEQQISVVKGHDVG